MADNRKYYYLKLKESYFDEDAIVLLESMQDGMLYSNILLKLYLKSLKNGGKLQLAENIPYTAQMIATITRQQVGTVERACQKVFNHGYGFFHAAYGFRFGGCGVLVNHFKLAVRKSHGITSCGCFIIVLVRVFSAGSVRPSKSARYCP